MLTSDPAARPHPDQRVLVVPNNREAAQMMLVVELDASLPCGELATAARVAQALAGQDGVARVLITGVGMEPSDALAFGE